ncbi:hypothetical protein V8B97DRAFT_607457 [Scleroderma yunnanense]
MVPLQAHTLETEEIDHDIYRGDRQHISRLPEVRSLALSSSSSASASSFIPGIGALAAVVEHAISRWARRNSSASSSSSSTISSHSQHSSTYPHARRHGRKRKAQSASISTSTASERDISARIRARQEARQVPREFVLYLPPEMTAGSRHPPAPYTKQDIFRGTSLPHVLNTLENALKKATRLRKGKTTDPSSLSQNIGSTSPDFSQHNHPLSFVDATAQRRSKGKQKAATQSHVSVHSGTTVRTIRSPKAWWLDISSPTWDDMRAIGKRDTREKLEWFPKLGYQFIVFRAMESARTRQRIISRNGMMDGYQDDEGLIGETNVYLVVFRDGICTFHFTDISEHIERVRTRVQFLQDNVAMSSDWIAHGLLDSVVDSFFPILKEIEKDVASIENILFANEAPTESSFSGGSSSFDTEDPKGTITEKELQNLPSSSFIEKVEAATEVVPRFSIPRLTIPLAIRHLKRKVVCLLQGTLSTSKARVISTQTATSISFRHMARTRRLVTSLARLLASKSEVVSQMRKRYLGTGKAIHIESVEIAMYMGDVQDHILTLQQALSHYEHILSESYPAYLSQLRKIVSDTKNSSDKAVLILSLVSFGALVPGPIIGLFSMNVHTPRNTIDNPIPSGGYYWFGIVLVLVLFVECSFLALLRYWWVQSKSERKPKLL